MKNVILFRICLLGAVLLASIFVMGYLSLLNVDGNTVQPAVLLSSKANESLFIREVSSDASVSPIVSVPTVASPDIPMSQPTETSFPVLQTEAASSYMEPASSRETLSSTPSRRPQSAPDFSDHLTSWIPAISSEHSESMISKPPVSSTVSSETAIEVIDTEEIWNENQQLANDLAHRYGISILFSPDDISGDSIIVSPETDPLRMQQALAETEAALTLFPTDFFDHTVTLLFGEQLTDTESVCWDAAAGGSVFRISCRGSRLRTELQNALLDFSAELFLTETDFSFDPWNPVDFYYDISDQTYLYSSQNPHDGYFLSMNGQESDDADQKEFFLTLFRNPRTLIQAEKDSALYAKCLAFCEAVSAWRSVMAENTVVQHYLFSA